MPRTLREVVFVEGVRTPFGRAGDKGMYAQTRADDLVVNCIRELLRRHPELPPQRVEEVAIAATTQIGDQGLTLGRVAALLAGLPKTTPGYSIDRMCAGAMTAVTNVASAIADIFRSLHEEHGDDDGHEPEQRRARLLQRETRDRDDHRLPQAERRGGQEWPAHLRPATADPR